MRGTASARSWQNANGVVIAKSITDLTAEQQPHQAAAVTEKGAVVNGRGESQQHTFHGSDPDGRAFGANADRRAATGR